MGGGCVFDVGDASNFVMSHRGELVIAIGRDDFLAFVCRNDSAVAAEQLDAVVRSWIVAGGNLNARRGFVFSYQNPTGRGGRNVGVNHVSPHR